MAHFSNKRVKSFVPALRAPFVSLAPVAALAGLACLTLAAGCGEERAETSLPLPPYSEFQDQPYTVLLRDCGFPACHGNNERFFRVFGPGRSRISGSLDTDAVGQPTLDEISQTHLSAGSMIDPDDLDNSPLLRKPLSVAAGGAGHQGVDGFGRDVYRSEQDSGYVVLREWVRLLQPAPAAAPAAGAP